MITGYDPERRTLKTGIGDLIGLDRLPEDLIPSDNPLSLQLRQRVHGSYQKRMEASGWRREVTTSLDVQHGEVTFSISGRMDLLKQSDGRAEILELKTLNRTPDFSDPVQDRPDHVLQLYFYALALAEEEGLDLGSITAELVYLPITGSKDDSEYRYVIDLEDAGIQGLWNSLLSRTADMLIREDERKREQIRALEVFSFPYTSMRPGQEKIVEHVSRCLEKRGYLLLQAPTGTGKTASIITGAIGKAVPERLTLFFLTAKNTHKAIVAETMKLIDHQGLSIRTILISAKAKLCHRGRERCLPHDCPYAMQFRRRVLETGVMETLLDEVIIEPEVLREKAEEAGVCAFELALCLSLRCDMVVCDYNYVFDPHVFLKRFFLEPGTSARCSLLVDEAANLPDRARDYYSPEVRLSWIHELLEMDGLPESRRKLLEPWLARFDEWEKLLDSSGSSETELPGDTELPSDVGSWLEEISEVLDPPAALIDLVRSLVDISRIESDDGRFHLLVRRDGNDPVLQWFCTDPSDFISQRLLSCHSRVAFSATLKPFDHFGYLNGFPMDETECCEIDYPFPSENLRVWICPEVDTRYRSREDHAPLIADRIVGLFRSAPGTWLVFFPSFSFMETVCRYLEGYSLPILKQEPGMKTEDRRAFIQEIENGENVTLTVSGGIFSEGVDIKSAGLMGAVVVGPSLPGVDLRSKLLSKSYSERGMDGFLHTWAVPGMVRVVQAAGRLIRNSHQRRALVLMGDRFRRQPYFSLLPDHWFHRGSIGVMKEDTDQIREFLEKEKGQRENAAPDLSK